MNVIHVLNGGPTLKISVSGIIRTFEMHPFCGPILLKRNGEAAKDQRSDFLNAATLWVQQGKRMEGGLCRWDHEPKPITKHMGGQHHKIIGWTEPRKGE